MGKMLEVLPESRQELSEFAPRILTIHIDPEKIGKLIGPGGKTVRGLQENYGVKIDIEEDGTVYVSGEGLSAEQALQEVQRMTEEVQVGKIYTGTVVRVEPYGAFINIMPGVDGMVHISQLADYRVDKVEDIAKLGDELTAMVIDVDPGGKVRMSRQAVLEGWTVEEAQAARPRRTAQRWRSRRSRRAPRRRPWPAARRRRQPLGWRRPRPPARRSGPTSVGLGLIEGMKEAGTGISWPASLFACRTI